MNRQEVNTIIARFMGEKSIAGAKWITNWSASLDALVPVVEKLLTNDVAEFALFWNRNGSWAETFNMKKSAHIDSGMLCPSMALATACAKVIKELKNDNA